MLNPTQKQICNAEITFEIARNNSGAPVDLIVSLIQAEIEKRNKGEMIKHAVTKLVTQIVGMKHPVLLVGPAGCGKTTIGEQVASDLNLPFFITSTIFDTHELLGFVDGHGQYHSTAFRQAFENGGVWIADEIDAWDAAALLAANSALANGFATFPDCPKPVVRHVNFRMIGTANTFGSGADRLYVGRNELDAASLDRFATVDVDYDPVIEMNVCNSNIEWLEYVREVRSNVERLKIRHVVSTRAVAMGSKALENGIDLRTVCNLYLFKGMSKNDRERVE